MEQYIKDYAIGYYNDDRVKVIRKLEKGEILSDCDASSFILDYDKVLPESVRRWKERLRGAPLDKEEMARLASELRDADPTGWTDKQALDVLARRLMDMMKSARGYTERDILSKMLRRCHPDVTARMDELYMQDVRDNIWFDHFLDMAELREAGQAPSD